MTPGENPETTFIVDLPANLEAALQDESQLGDLVETEMVFSPSRIVELTPEQVVRLFGVSNESPETE